MIIYNILTFDELNSTNTYVKENYKTLPENAVVIAKKQLAGKGRLGKKFHSLSSGSIYMSLLLDNPQSPEQITIRAAVCVHRAILEAYGLSCGIKWVNDIYFEDKKLCGILCETCGGNKMVCGIGVNVEKYVFPSDVAEVAACIEDFAPGAKKDLLIDEILKQMDAALSEDFRDILHYYKANCFIFGRELVVFQGNQSFEATAFDLSDSGALMVRDCVGAVHTLSSGEVALKIKSKG